jgi:DNA-binding MarR family transcriptional regulator
VVSGEVNVPGFTSGGRAASRIASWIALESSSSRVAAMFAPFEKSTAVTLSDREAVFLARPSRWSPVSPDLWVSGISCLTDSLVWSDRHPYVSSCKDVLRREGVSVTTRWLNDDEQAAWRSWLDMYRLLLPALDRQLQSESRASFTDFEVLVHLSEVPGRRLRMSELADRTLSTRSAITRTVDRLVAREWVLRVRSADDQRGYYADLTDLGAAVLAEIAPGHVNAVRSYLIDLLSESELTALREIGDKVRRRIGGRSGPAA